MSKSMIKPLLSLFARGTCKAGNPTLDAILTGLAHPISDGRWVVSQWLLQVRSLLSTDGEAVAAVLATLPEIRTPRAAIVAARCQEAGRLSDPNAPGAAGHSVACVRTRENGGTVLYSAPEYSDCISRKGSFQQLLAGDIYSLGVLLYQLTTGRPPHDTQTQVRSHAPFPKPREVNGGICAEIEEVINDVPA